ncbi:hypothetical protein T492DRAFT_907920 [Pavlovales sp. CCMP2436]|nr:hypothetical protein T492DRAFT_907920 [Pavlovales sp. CCMP2436]
MHDSTMCDAMHPGNTIFNFLLKTHYVIIVPDVVPDDHLQCAKRFFLFQGASRMFYAGNQPPLYLLRRSRRTRQSASRRLDRVDRDTPYLSVIVGGRVGGCGCVCVCGNDEGRGARENLFKTRVLCATDDPEAPVTPPPAVWDEGLGSLRPLPPMGPRATATARGQAVGGERQGPTLRPRGVPGGALSLSLVIRRYLVS